MQRQLVNLWVKSGTLKPIRNGSNRTGHRFTLTDVLVVAIALDLRRRGFSLEQATDVVAYLRKCDLSNRIEHWQWGDCDKTLILAIGDSGVSPNFMSKNDIYKNPEICLLTAYKLGVPVAILDIFSCLTIVEKKIRELKLKKTTNTKIQAERPKEIIESEAQ